MLLINFREYYIEILIGAFFIASLCGFIYSFRTHSFVNGFLQTAKIKLIAMEKQNPIEKSKKEKVDNQSTEEVASQEEKIVSVEVTPKVYRLDALYFADKNNWEVWINGQCFCPDNMIICDGVKIISVSHESVIIDDHGELINL
jgi:hypothetical protein